MKYTGAKYIDKVPFSKRKGRTFLESRKQLYDEISDSDWIRAICIHEAAHIFYYRQFGANEFIYHGPEMGYDRDAEGYMIRCAGIEPQKPYTKKPMTFTEGLELEARLAVSGSVAAALFTELNEGGKDDDFKSFEEMCAELNIINAGRANFDARTLWDKARIEVEADFKLRQNRAAIFTEAENIRTRLFPWATLPIVDSPDVQDESEISNQP